jgi:hypothetical protein
MLTLFCWQEILAPVLARPDLIITRNVEWANLAFGFEQVLSVSFFHICRCSCTLMSALLSSSIIVYLCLIVNSLEEH